MVDRPHPARTAPRPPWWERAAFGGLIACAIWAPIPLGSNRPWALALLAMALWALLFCLLAGHVLGGHSRFWGRLTRSAWPWLLLGLFAALVAAQWLAPAGGRLFGTLDGYLTRYYQLATLVHLAAFGLVILTVSTARRASLLLGAVMAGGVLQSVLAVALFSAAENYQFLFHDFDQGGRAMGTFPNPDHLAGYLELCLSAGLGLMLSQFARGEPQRKDWRQRTLDVLAFVMSPKMLLRLMLVVMVLALVMTHSRMGNGAFFLALLLLAAVVAIASQGLRRPALWLVASMVVIDVAVIGQWVGLERLVDRMQATAQQSIEMAAAQAGSVVAASHKVDSIQDRLQVPRLSLPLIQSRPWWGHGGATYVLAFPAIKPPGHGLHWDHAHNDYVEIAVDTGLVGLGLLLAFALATAWRAAGMLGDAQPRLKRGVGAAALMALCCMGLHSMVDFNLQIPANAMTLVLLMGLVWAMPRGGSLDAQHTATTRM